MKNIQIILLAIFVFLAVVCTYPMVAGADVSQGGIDVDAVLDGLDDSQVQIQGQQQGQTQEQSQSTVIDTSGNINNNQTAGNINIKSNVPFQAPAAVGFRHISPSSAGGVWNNCWKLLPKQLTFEGRILQMYERYHKIIPKPVWAPECEQIPGLFKTVKLVSEKDINAGQRLGVATFYLRKYDTRISPHSLVGAAMYDASLRGADSIFVLECGVDYENRSRSANKGFMSFPFSFGKTNSSGFGSSLTFGPQHQRVNANRVGKLYATFLYLRISRDQPGVDVEEVVEGIKSEGYEYNRKMYEQLLKEKLGKGRRRR